MKIVETSHCGVSMCFIAVGWTAAASAGQAPLSLPGCCLPGNCRRSLSYGYGRLRLSDAGGLLSRSASLCVIARHEAIQVILPLLVVAVQGQGFPSLRTSPLPNPPAPFKGEVCRRSATLGGSMFFLEMWGGRRFFWFLWGVRFAFFSKIGCMVEN